MQIIITRPAIDIQFFLDLKMLILDRASLSNCFRFGITSLPFACLHLYEGSWRI